MTKIDSQTFKDRYGCSAPAALLEFLNDELLRTSLPTTFAFENVEFTLGIQYLLDIEEPANFDDENKRLAFATNTDGHELLVDLKSQAGDVLQNEFGDIDSLGISLQDLMSATRQPLG